MLPVADLRIYRTDMSADTVEFEKDFASQLTEREARTRCAFLVADNERLRALMEHHKKALTEQSRAGRVPFDSRTSTL